VSVNNLGDLVEIHNVIVGDFVGQATLFRSARASTSNRTFASARRHPAGKNEEAVRCITVDSLLAGLDFRQHVFIIKIDVEGNELRVLRGMEGLLRQSKGFVLLYEYYPSGIVGVGLKPAEMRSFIADLNPDWACMEVGGRLVCVGVPGDLVEAMAAIDTQRNPRCDSCGNFIVGRGVSSDFLEAGPTRVNVCGAGGET
jgi:FkbM family methyltransferase